VDLTAINPAWGPYVVIPLAFAGFVALARWFLTTQSTDRKETLAAFERVCASQRESSERIAAEDRAAVARGFEQVLAEVRHLRPFDHEADVTADVPSRNGHACPQRHHPEHDR
jgi:hypothetical protein